MNTLAGAVPPPPEPTPQDLAASAAVAARIRAACERGGGSIGFDQYMDIALYAPGEGYYCASRARLGPDGDFVTAPEIASEFSRCVARQIAQVLSAIGGGDVLEVGAGSGAMAADLLVALEALGVTPGRYWLIERSASARAAQRERLGAQRERVAWLDRPPERFCGVVLANELLDALPAWRFAITERGARELRVRVEGDGFGWALAPLRDDAEGRALQAMLSALAPLPPGYVSEFGPQRGAWVATIAGALEVGVLLLIDYGYPRAELYHPQRGAGTLACYYRHRRHDDPFALPGAQDISVHVDFSAVADAGRARGLELAGFTTQAQFLLATGLLDAAAGRHLSAREQVELTARIRRLTLPSEMGEAVKVMALSRDVDAALEGFALRDLSHRL